MLIILSPTPFSRSATLGILPSEQAPSKGCQACISRYRIAQTTCAMQRNLTCPAFFQLAPYFPAVRFIKLQRPKKKEKLPRSLGRPAIGSRPPLSLAALNCSTSFEATEIA